MMAILVKPYSILMYGAILVKPYSILMYGGHIGKAIFDSHV